MRCAEGKTIQDGTEGKLTVLPDMTELQTGEHTRDQWIQYSCRDTGVGAVLTQINSLTRGSIHSHAFSLQRRRGFCASRLSSTCVRSTASRAP